MCLSSLNQKTGRRTVQILIPRIIQCGQRCSRWCNVKKVQTLISWSKFWSTPVLSEARTHWTERLISCQKAEDGYQSKEWSCWILSGLTICVRDRLCFTVFRMKLNKTHASLSNAMQFWGYWRFMQIRQRILNSWHANYAFNSRRNSETFDVLHAFLSLVVAKLSDLKNSPVFFVHPVFQLIFSAAEINIRLTALRGLKLGKLGISQIIVSEGHWFETDLIRMLSTPQLQWK